MVDAGPSIDRGDKATKGTRTIGDDHRCEAMDDDLQHGVDGIYTSAVLLER